MCVLGVQKKEEVCFSWRVQEGPTEEVEHEPGLVEEEDQGE